MIDKEKSIVDILLEFVDSIPDEVFDQVKEREERLLEANQFYQERLRHLESILPPFEQEEGKFSFDTAISRAKQLVKRYEALLNVMFDESVTIMKPACCGKTTYNPVMVEKIKRISKTKPLGPFTEDEFDSWLAESNTPEAENKFETHDIAVKLGCISVDKDGTKHFDIKKFLSTPEGREHWLKLNNKMGNSHE